MIIFWFVRWCKPLTWHKSSGRAAHWSFIFFCSADCIEPVLIFQDELSLWIWSTRFTPTRAHPGSRLWSSSLYYQIFWSESCQPFPWALELFQSKQFFRELRGLSCWRWSYRSVWWWVEEDYCCNFCFWRRIGWCSLLSRAQEGVQSFDIIINVAIVWFY